MRLTLFILLSSLVFAPVASAQIFSPGKLSRGHKKLEGLNNCLKCHDAGNALSNSKCLACHKVLKSAMATGRGLHARQGNSSCNTCHKEHRGVATSLVDWGNGRKMERFVHTRTGWALAGKHKSTKCRDCHQRKFVQLAPAKRLKRKTFLGLGTKCSLCHEDAHAGQFTKSKRGGACNRCHSSSAFKPAAKFKHNRDSRFALTGKHRRVRCASCHKKDVDAGESIVRYRPLSFSRCTACHRDPHRGDRGKRCSQCHQTSGWNLLKQSAKDLGFHAKTEFPLKGEHAEVSCKSCHGPFRGQRGKGTFKGLAFRSCSDCHVDGHRGELADLALPKATPSEGQLSLAKFANGPDCARCHDEESFSPARFGLEEHAQTKYALEGAHRAVDCRSCHGQKSRRVSVPAAAKRALASRGRTPVSARMVFKTAPFNDCAGCHKDEHRGQLTKNPDGTKRRCAQCHSSVDAFSAPDFSHNRDSSFTLDGAHVDVDCAKCHAQKTESRARFTEYKSTPKTCSACHTDVHGAQFVATASDKGDVCARCHTTATWKSVAFDHDKTQFALSGAHARAACSACHQKSNDVVWYAGLPTACASCHEDQHDGKFDAFSPVSPVAARPTSDKARVSCRSCHSELAWQPANFAHERTGFPLAGAHKRALCSGCHTQAPGDALPTKVPAQCASCHRDVHSSAFGTLCQSCHTPENWQSFMTPNAHRLTAFPLLGQHGLLPCEECHDDRRDLAFFQNARACSDCHIDDYLQAGTRTVDHQRSNFSQNCRDCHAPVTFQGAQMETHERCFPLERSVHQGVSCRECHSALAGSSARGNCRQRDQVCTTCHAHQEDETRIEHDGIDGYEYADLKCVGCHSFLEPR